MAQNNFLKRYTRLSFAIDYFETGQLDLPSPTSWDDKNDSSFLEAYAEKKGASGIYALCLSRASETFHHWSVFSPESKEDEEGKEAGACIEFKTEPLLKAAARAGLSDGEVEYIKIEQLKPGSFPEEKLPFLKRLPYQDEQEFRMFIAPSSPPEGTLFPFEVPLEAVRNVKLSPWMSPQTFEHWKSFIKKIPGCEQLKVYRSTLLDNERWKKSIANMGSDQG